MSLIGYSNPSGHGIAQVAASLAIVAEHSFFLKQQNPTISFKDSVERALDDYLHSPQYSATMLAVQALDITQDRTSNTSSIRSLFQSKKAVDEVSLQILHRKLTQIVQENHLTQHT
ncbi:hypothetical protein Hypma_009756 [Hypsizygus marmoreus]|uniref:Uncharacterized protein n=1 Tax=Hypsizygus marmoreus TaxID=39966 RepID=A0A369JP50_HYPMA|nr:hypothetical protein Hypma_009756 [Hypsizygus marmoreus]